MKDLGGILDEKIAKKSSSIKLPKNSNENFPSTNKNLSLDVEIEKNKKVIKRQKQELQILENRLSQVNEGIFLEKLESEIKQLKNEIEEKKKAKKQQEGFNLIAGKQLEDIVEVKKAPENLQKSSIIDSDLLILKTKQRGLLEKIQKNLAEVEKFMSREKKIDKIYDETFSEAKELNININQTLKKQDMLDLKSKIERTQKFIGSLNATHKRELQKLQKQINDIKILNGEKDQILKEKNENLIKIRQKLSSLLSNENVDKSIKGMINLFTNSNVSSEVQDSRKNSNVNTSNFSLKKNNDNQMFLNKTPMNSSQNEVSILNDNVPILEEKKSNEIEKIDDEALSIKEDSFTNINEENKISNGINLEKEIVQEFENDLNEKNNLVKEKSLLEENEMPNKSNSEKNETKIQKKDSIMNKNKEIKDFSTEKEHSNFDEPKQKIEPKSKENKLSIKNSISLKKINDQGIIFNKLFLIFY